MAFEWDVAKNATNLLKHGIDSHDAVHIFDGPFLEVVDDRRDDGETRMIAVGMVEGRELTVVYAVRGRRCCIISARRAHSRERKA